MRKNKVIKLILLVLAMMIIVPVILNYEAKAATGGDGKRTYSNVWLLETKSEKHTNGSLNLEIKTYIKNGNIYEESPYINTINVKYDSDPGNSTVTVENGYTINRLELWGNNIKESDIKNGSINITFGKLKNKTLKIYLDEKYNDVGYGGNDNVTGGDVLLDKKVTPVEGSTNVYDLELSVIGTAISKEKNADIILVFDKSGSMKENMDGIKTKADVLEEAANRFIDVVLPKNKPTNNRVAIVAYSNESQILQQFTSNNTTAKSNYKNYEQMVSGGTNSESGFITSRKVFGDSFRVGAERFVIYMTDGVPTQYYNINGEVVGLGDKYDVKAKDAAVDEANLLKNFGGSGVKIYTVGLAPSNTSEMEALLNPSVKSYQETYYYAKTADDLTSIYDNLATIIINAIATEAKIMDILPDGFEFIRDSIPEGVTVSEDGVLSWNLGSISTEKASKNVRIKYIGEKYGIVYSNEDAEIEYKHILSSNAITEKQFDNPLSMVVPNISEYVYYTNKGENIIITPPNIELINEAGVAYTISDLRIKTDGKTSKPNSSVSHNSDNTEITFVPQAEGYPEDSFSYTVYFTISSNDDPYDLLEGNSKVYEQKVNVIINPHPDVNLTINYFEVLEGLHKPLSINGVKSVVIPLPKDAYIDEFAPNATGYELIDITYDGIVNPVIAGRRLTGRAGSKNITINFYYKRDSSIFDNILLNNSMYASNELIPIGNNLETYRLVPGINYRFGLEFQAGQNVDVLELVFAGNTGDFTLSDFRLYDQNNILIGGPEGNINAFDSMINANSFYTITYNVRPNNSGLSLSVSINNVVTQSSTVPIQININSIDNLELE